MQACESSQTAQPSPADCAPATAGSMQSDSAASPLGALDRDEAAAGCVGNSAGSTAEASFAGLVLGKLAVRGHARLVSRALWHAMRQHVVASSGAGDRTNASDMSRSAGVVSGAATWGAPASLGPAGASAVLQPPCITATSHGGTLFLRRTLCSTA